MADAMELHFDLPDDPLATERLGERLGQHLVAGNTVALDGPLGAGKTTLVRGLARGLDIDDPDAVSSPTYLLVVEHDGPTGLLHADAYLPQKLAGFLDDGGVEYLFDNARVVVVEWASNVRKLLPENTLWIELQRGEQPGRRVVLRTSTAGDYAWLSDLRTMPETL